MKARFKFTDVFNVNGRGIVICGYLIEGNIDKRCVVIMGDERIPIMGLEQFKKLMDGAGPGENFGILLGKVPLEFVKKYRGTELIINNISEIREEKLKGLLK